ncbi:unnamed protein product [Paramecium sonneborni]|uniref:RING-type domain-containing protein n=1 Tax=Paramecium sonneborni TaxID=65129 RepID=A0A8S1QEI8_9CILI|nr:unnamed protein product [Paramecium sonneborni]
MQRIRVQQIKITAGSQLEQNQQDRGSFQNNYIACNLCDQIMQENVYQIHIKMCEQQIKNGNLFEQECQQCGLIIIKLYYNDHLDICEANCWIQVKCPYCFIAVFKVDLKDHISKCSFFLNQQQKEKEGIQNCAVCLEDVIENKSQLNCSHIFHQDCINNWLILHRNCPICKKTQDK